MLMLLFFALLSFLSLSFSQLDLPRFPPNVAFVNSDFNATISNIDFPVLGHLAYIQGVGTYVIAYVQDLTVEEWLITEKNGQTTSYILSNGNCESNVALYSNVVCTPWAQNTTEYRQECKLSQPGFTGSITYRVLMGFNGQVEQSHQIVFFARPPTLQLVSALYTNPSSEPPALFTPPSNCTQDHPIF
eukprot:TRINITY_DN5283_c0_g4_i6.p1 TRINITY_DN5283_c0_g4~~TRINITY_DN5283_c0_g4_i6.p1  ORF type:complete len:188 (+),score=13.90 TRINITY_DN5283_c0_g4_i6:74-637(+)